MRVGVACINWTHADAPHAMSFVIRDGDLIAEAYHATWAEAMERANELAATLKRAVTS